MFCEKCGNPLHEGDAFCEKCGTPVAQAPTEAEQPPVQPSGEQVNAQTDAQPGYGAQPNYNAEPNHNAQPAYGTGYQAPVPTQPKVKKPFPKKLAIKLGVICGAAAVVIVGVIVALSIIIPNLNKLEVKDYIKVTIDESYLYNGYARATVAIDETSIEIDRLTDGDSESESSSDYDLSDYIDALSDYSKLYSASEAIDEVLDYVTVSAYEKEAGESTAVTCSGGSYSDQITDLDKDDVIVVEIKWDKSDSAKKAISKLEDEAGFKFDQTDTTTEIKVSDVLSDKNLELEEVHGLDIVSYIKENNLVKTTGLKDGEYSVAIDSFSYTVGDYTIQYDSSSSYGYGVDIVDKYETTVETVYLEFSKSSGLSADSKFTISTSQELIEDASILVSETTEEFTVTENKVMSSDEAKSNIDKITEATEKYIEDQYYNRLSDYSAAEVYYVTPKSSKSDTEAYVVVIEKGKYDSYFTDYDTYYSAYYIENPYMIGDSLYYSGMSGSSGDEKLADCKEASGFFDTEDYAATKIN